MGALPRLSRLLSAVEWGLSTLAAIAMFAVMTPWVGQNPPGMVT